VTAAQPDIACIALDWGTSNRRGWALDGSGNVLARRADDQGLIAISSTGGDFAASLAAFAEGWLGSAPVVMAGMVGSRAGWREVPYLETPTRLDAVGLHLASLPALGGSPVYIVPGMARRDGAQPDVMRGEECQLLGAQIARGIDSGSFLLPGTHAKWALVESGSLTAFRTYMTGELFGLLSRQGSLSQSIKGDDFDRTTFRQGLERARDTTHGNLGHQLFGTRSLTLFGALQPGNAASYLSGLLIGAEMADALLWLRSRDPALRRITAIGAESLLRNYAEAAAAFEIDLDRLDSDAILPPALFALAKQAGLLGV